MFVFFTVIFEIFKEIVVIFKIFEFFTNFFLHFFVIFLNAGWLFFVWPILVCIFVFKFARVGRIAKNKPIILAPQLIIAENSISLSNSFEKFFTFFNLFRGPFCRNHIRMVLFGKLVILSFDLLHICLSWNIQKLIVACSWFQKIFRRRCKSPYSKKHRPP